MTPHNEAKKEDIAKIVLMPGDPLRAKYIAENFLENPKLINTVRNMLGYTGIYKGKKITVFAHGMGIPSMGIYSYELFKFYDVETIIRIGSCGCYSKDLDLLDTVLVDKSYTESNYAFTFAGENSHLLKADNNLNNLIKDTSNEKNISIKEVNCFCSDCFDVYVPSVDNLMSRFPKDLNIEVAEMESFALFYNANLFNKKASCLLSVVDSIYKNESVSPEKRESALNNMIILALETAIKL